MELHKWAARELELSRKHEELIMRREVLLRGTERYFNMQDHRAASFIADIGTAEERNQQLRRDIDETRSKVRRSQEIVSPRFDTLRKNYWSMVRSVFPVWYDHYNSETKHPSHSGSAHPGTSGISGSAHPGTSGISGSSHPGTSGISGSAHPGTSGISGSAHPVTSGISGSAHPGTSTLPQTYATQPGTSLTRHRSPSSSKRSTSAPLTPQDRTRANRQHDEDATITEVPPLDLDFSIGDDVTSQNITPKVTMETSSKVVTMETISSQQTSDKQGKKEKRVLFDEAQLSAVTKKSSGKSKSKSKKSNT